MAITNLRYKNADFELSYELLNLDKEPILLILHGWGASKELMQSAFKDKFQNYKHLYIDLCGFGKSSAPLILNSFDYALILKLFLAQKSLAPALLMGHSFGGKLCALLSLENEDFSSFCKKNLKGDLKENLNENLNFNVLNSNLKALILLSSAGILKQKSLKVRFKIKFFKTLKKLGLGHFGKFFASKDALGLNALMYETFKNVVNENFSEVFKKIHTKSFIFWGIDDEATPLRSGEKMHALIKNSKFYTLKGDHFFFLDPKNSAFVDEILNEMEKQK